MSDTHNTPLHCAPLSPRSDTLSSFSPFTHSYYAGGRYYYGGYRPYNYYYGNNVFLYGAVFYSVGPRGYGCYSCGHYGYRGGCNSRRSCGDSAPTTAMVNLDRYQIDLTFTAPADESRWPLTVRMYNATVFVPRRTMSDGTGNAGQITRDTRIYLNFFTESGDTYDTLRALLHGLGWPGAIITLLVMLCNKKAFCPSPEDLDEDSRNPIPRNLRPAVQEMQAVQGYAQQPQPMGYVQQPQMGYAQAMPMAQPMGMAQAMPVAYPSGQQPMPVAYPSNPPSPPAMNKDD